MHIVPLTAAVDWSTVYTSTRTPLVTQRRSPARVTVAVVVVVAKLVIKQNQIQIKCYRYLLVN